MKILFLCTYYHRAMFFKQQVDFLNKSGHVAKVFNTAKKGDHIKERFKTVIDDNVYHVECWNSLDRLLYFPRQFKTEKELAKAYNVSEFDLIHSHLLLSSGSIAYKIKKSKGVPYVVSIRNTDLVALKTKPFLRRLAIKICVESNGMLFLSYSHRDYFFSHFLRHLKSDMLNKLREKSCVIGNCVETFWETNIYYNKSPEYHVPLRVLAVAKIVPSKNLLVACKAIEILNEKGLETTLTIAGECRDESELKRISSFRHTTYLGFLKKEELIDIYRESDIFLLPSLNETFGRSYVEAMTQGLPVIYSKSQGFDGFFDEGFVGYSVDPKSPFDVSKAIIKVMDNYGQISKQCLFSSSVFSEKEVMEKLESFYQNSIENKAV